MARETGGLAKLNELRAEARKLGVEWQGLKTTELEAAIAAERENYCPHGIIGDRCTTCYGDPFDDIDPETEGDHLDANGVDITDPTAYDALQSAGWLNRAMRELSGMCSQVGASVDPSRYAASIGYGPHGRSLGVCDPSHGFIRPTLGDPVTVLADLLHGMLHAGVGTSSHTGEFTKAARSLGLMGGGPHKRQWGKAVAGTELQTALREIADELGEYPHKPIAEPTKQATLMRKVWCPSCGCIIRTSDRWLNMYAFTCPCGTKMQVDR